MHWTWDSDSFRSKLRVSALGHNSAWCSAQHAQKAVFVIKRLAIVTISVTKYFEKGNERKCLIDVVRGEDLWRHIAFKETILQKIRQIYDYEPQCVERLWGTNIPVHGWTKEKKPFKVFELSSSGVDWVRGSSEFLISVGMQTKARSPIHQYFERNNH